MRNRRIPFLIGGVCGIVALFRIVLSFLHEGFSYPAYFLLRQSASVAGSAAPFFFDPLSYGGRWLAFNPLYAYLIGGPGALFGVEEVMRILPNLIAATVPLMAYLISMHLIKDRRIGVLVALFSGFIPIQSAVMHNSAHAFSFVLPLSLLTTYLLLRQKYAACFWVALAFIVFHPGSWLWILGFGFYLLFSWLEHIKTPQVQKELFLTLLLAAALWHIIIFKNALTQHGVGIIWQNVPLSIRAALFVDFNLFSVLSFVGIVPLVGAAWAIYHQFYRSRDTRSLFLVAQIVAGFVLLWLTVVRYEEGLMYFSLWLVMLLPVFFGRFFAYLERTKFRATTSLMWVGVLTLFFLTAVLPSVFFSLENPGPDEDYLQMLSFLQMHTPADATIIDAPSRGQLITAKTGRKTFMDTEFMLAPNPDTRLRDLERFYTSSISTQALEVLADYQITSSYVVYDSNSQEKYWDSTARFAQDTRCFVPIYAQEGLVVYQVMCRLVPAGGDEE
ncbi:MAG: hypothetical protein ACOCWQ_04165 [Nanoarchaeota archaeon]